MYLHTPPKTNTSPERMQVGKITFTFEMAPFLGDIRSFSGVHIVSYSYSAVHPPLETSEPQVCLGIANGRCLLKNPWNGWNHGVKRPNRLSQLEVFKEQEVFSDFGKASRLEVFHDQFLFGWFGGKKDTPWKMNGWNLQPSPIWKGKWSEPNLHHYGPC